MIRRNSLHFLVPSLLIGAMLLSACLAACTAGSVDNSEYGYGAY
jgi:hypothetical protein